MVRRSLTRAHREQIRRTQIARVEAFKAHGGRAPDGVGFPVGRLAALRKRGEVHPHSCPDLDASGLPLGPRMMVAWLLTAAHVGEPCMRGTQEDWGRLVDRDLRTVRRWLRRLGPEWIEAVPQFGDYRGHKGARIGLPSLYLRGPKTQAILEVERREDDARTPNRTFSERAHAPNRPKCPATSRARHNSHEGEEVGRGPDVQGQDRAPLAARLAATPAAATMARLAARSDDEDPPRFVSAAEAIAVRAGRPRRTP